MRQVAKQLGVIPLNIRQKIIYRLFGGALNEVAIVFRVIGGNPGVMLDVGAHWGTSLAPFLASGWTVHAFEPDPTNRAKLLADHPGAIIDPRAVSEKDGETVTFFTSDVSSGISTLSPFHPSHVPTATVQTVRLDTYLRDHGIEQVDFVKTDVEGFDLFALRTFPWETHRPDAVVCEFEDCKTIKLGYTAKDLAQFLEQKGYSIVVSEWYPVVEYGTQHTWRRFKRYPSDIPTNSHGNLIAVKPALLPQIERASRSAARRLHTRQKVGQLLRVD